MPTLQDNLKIIKEKDNVYDAEVIAAYNVENEKIGDISKNSCYNSKVFKKNES